MPDDGSRQKEAYARFGLAMYRAQVFEHGLANAITLSTLVLSNESDIKQEQIDAILDDLFTHTAGKLLRRLRQVLDMSDQDADLIRRAINVWNRLAHHFFREHAEDMMTAAGMQRVLDDADAARRVLVEADEMVDMFTMVLFRLLGMTPDRIGEMYDELMRRAQELGDATGGPQTAH